MTAGVAWRQPTRTPVFLAPPDILSPDVSLQRARAHEVESTWCALLQTGHRLSRDQRLARTTKGDPGTPASRLTAGL